MSPPVVPALHSHPVGMPDTAVDQASAGLYEQYNAEATAAAPLPPGLSAPSDSRELWPALRPPGQDAATSIPNATMPSAATSAVANNASPAQPKSRALKLLREARQALAAGDLDQAEESARLGERDWRSRVGISAATKIDRRCWRGTFNGPERNQRRGCSRREYARLCGRPLRGPDAALCRSATPHRQFKRRRSRR